MIDGRARVDYIRVPVDGHREGEALLRRGARPAAEHEARTTTTGSSTRPANVTLAVMTPAHARLRVRAAAAGDDRAAASRTSPRRRRELEAAGVAGRTRCGTPASAAAPASAIPAGNRILLHRRYGPYEQRADALAAYSALPIPDTTEEHWRFTDLRGFDPERSRRAGTCPRDETSRRCSTWTWPATPRSPRTASTSRRRPEGVALRAAARGLRAAVLARRLGREVRGAQRGDVEERAARRRAEGRRSSRSRSTCASPSPARRSGGSSSSPRKARARR